MIVDAVKLLVPIIGALKTGTVKVEALRLLIVAIGAVIVDAVKLLVVTFEVFRLPKIAVLIKDIL